MKYQIVNIIANTDIGEKLNLDTIVKSFNNCEYEPEIHFALIYRLDRPKISIIINRSGKLYFTGSRRIEDIYEAKKKLFLDLKKIGYFPIDNEIKIHNIVVSVDLLKKVKFNMIQNLIHPTFKIIPKKNRIIIKNIQPKFTAMIHSSGKCLVLGLNDINLINQMLGLINEWVDSFFIQTN